MVVDGISFVRCGGRPLFMETLLCLSKKFLVYAFDEPLIIVRDWKLFLSTGDLLSLRNPSVIADVSSVEKNGGYVTAPTARGIFRLSLCEFPELSVPDSVPEAFRESKKVYSKVLDGTVPPASSRGFPLYVSGGFTTFELDVFSLNPEIREKSSWELYVKKGIEVANGETHRVFFY